MPVSNVFLCVFNFLELLLLAVATFGSYVNQRMSQVRVGWVKQVKQIAIKTIMRKLPFQSSYSSLVGRFCFCFFYYDIGTM